MSKKKQLPLMPKATAVWLVDNTTLTFRQIADFCGMHELEVKGIADGEVAKGVMGMDPTNNGQLAREELDKAQADENYAMKLKVSEAYESVTKSNSKKKTTRYTPIARRQDKPDAIYWVIKNFPEVTDAEIIKLIGTTKNTVESIRDRSHWNMSNMRPRDPVLLGICGQRELDRLVEMAKLKAAANNPEGEGAETDEPQENVNKPLGTLSMEDITGTKDSE